MMASASLQARIHAFEALSAPNIAPRPPPNILERPISPEATSKFSPIVPSTPVKRLSPSPSPPNLGRKTSLIDLKDWVLDDGPLPSAPRRSRDVNGTSGVTTSNGRIPNVSSRHASDSALPSPGMITAPLINFDTGSPPRARPAPPLPPRRPSYTSLNSASTSAANSSTSSLPRSPVDPPRGPVHPVSPAPTFTRKSSDTLSVDPAHTYPPPGTLGISIPARGHVPASSISSFHSVSLSSDGGTEPATPASSIVPVERDDAWNAEHEPDNASLDESFENVSASAISPSVASVARDWEGYARLEPPKLPQRPKSTKPPTPASPPRALTATSPPSHISTLLKHQPLPPAPYRPRTPSSRASTSASTTPSASLSDRSSILSTATTATSYTSLSPAGNTSLTPKLKPKPAQLARPTPMPPAAHQRYEALFDRTLETQRRAVSAAAGKIKRPPPPPPPGRKPRQAAGWRGLSVDLLMGPGDVEKMGSAVASGEEHIEEELRLDGEAVRQIWACSRLGRGTLRTIWSECDPGGTGALDRVAFVQGMWRIDEELRRAELQRAMGVTRYGSGPSVRVRQPKRADSLLLRSMGFRRTWDT